MRNLFYLCIINDKTTIQMKQFIAYYRVSTKKQNLGLDAQQKTVNDYIQSVNGDLIAEYSEKESGKNDQRTELNKAIQECKQTGATLVIAKLDRLSRNVSFIFALKDSGVNFFCCDLPEMNTMTLGIFASIAQHERELISSRTKAALKAKKASGAKLGAPEAKFTPEMTQKATEARKIKAESNQNNIKAIAAIKDKIEIMRSRGEKINYSRIADELNEATLTTSRGGQFNAEAVKRLITRYQLTSTKKGM